MDADNTEQRPSDAQRRVLDKTGVLKRLGTLDEIVLDIGCGSQKAVPEAIGIDIADSECVDIVGEIDEVLDLLPQGCVTKVIASHFLEHVEAPAALLSRLRDVIKPGGTIEIIVPHFSNPFFYSDPTHRSAYGLYTFCYYATSHMFSRTVPSYSNIVGLELADIRLNFRSYRPHYVTHGVKKIVERIVNLSRAGQEFYEENLCYLLPCYEVKAVMRRTSSEFEAGGPPLRGIK